MNKLIPQLDKLQFNAVNQGQVAQITNALSFVQMIDAGIPPLPQREPKVDWEDIKDEKGLLPRDLKARLRGIASRIDELEPRSKDLSKKIADIENAHAAADQLPTDLADLAERKQELEKLISEAVSRSTEIKEVASAIEEARISLDTLADGARERVNETNQAAEKLIAKSERALRGATSVGLSKSFAARKSALSIAGILWTVGLIISLAAAVWIGSERVNSLRDVLAGDKSATIVWVNTLLAIIGVGAPIWFAWLSTKQIGSAFRLSEDYAFKASVAQAYEGYRAEAVSIDSSLQERLFASALDRFEEPPIRLIDTQYHSTPLQEVLSNPSLRKVLEAVPGIAEKVVALIPSKSGVAAAVVAPVTIAAAAGAALHDSPGSLKEDQDA